jgi:AmmeMemoRadiSam system protein A
MTAAREPLTPPQRADLLAIARRAICDRVCGLPDTPPRPEDPALCVPGAAFVTLTKAGALRGCIGYVHPVRPLADAVAHCAALAATGDPRFPALIEAELVNVQFEISVLSPLSPMTDPTQIQVGLHGLQIRKEGRCGLLLPQVATEYGWDPETFLSQVCGKARLPPHAWRHGAQVELFTVERISDDLPVRPSA